MAIAWRCILDRSDTVTLFGHRIQPTNKYDAIIATKRQLKCFESHATRMPWFLCTSPYVASTVKHGPLRKFVESFDENENPKRKELLKGYLSCFNVTKETTYVLNSLNLAIYAIQAQHRMCWMAKCGTFSSTAHKVYATPKRWSITERENERTRTKNCAIIISISDLGCAAMEYEQRTTSL